MNNNEGEHVLLNDIVQTALEECSVENQKYTDEVAEEAKGQRVEFDTVTFVRCRFMGCDFTGASFCNVLFDNCDFSNCTFGDSYWKNTKAKGCKGDGSRFTNSSFKWVTFQECQLRYANFSTTYWEFCEITCCCLREFFLSEVKFKKTTCSKTDLTQADFFRTPLKGMDLSDCTIDNIMVSDQYTELSGVKVNLFQVAELAKLMGVKIVQSGVLREVVHGTVRNNTGKTQEVVSMVEQKAIEAFLEVPSSRQPVPGGGGASALAGALGNAFGRMAGNLTIGKKKYADAEEEIQGLLSRMEKMQAQLVAPADRDAKVLAPLAQCYSLPFATPEEKAHKEKVMEERLLDASCVPLEIMEQAVEMPDILEVLREKGSRLAISDVGVGMQFIRTVVLGAVMNVYINTKSMKNRDKAEDLNIRAERLIEEGMARADRIYAGVLEQLK